MAKREWGSKRPTWYYERNPSHRWTARERDEMLLCLEHRAERQLSVDEVNAEISEHLSARFRLCVTRAQVSDEIYRIWRSVVGPEANLTDLTRAYRRGYKAFVDANDHAQLSRLNEAIEDFRCRQVRSAYETPRKLRSTSAATNTSGAHNRHGSTRSSQPTDVLLDTSRTATLRRPSGRQIAKSNKLQCKLWQTSMIGRKSLRTVRSRESVSNFSWGCKTEGSETGNLIQQVSVCQQAPASHCSSDLVWDLEEEQQQIPETPSSSIGLTVDSTRSRSTSELQRTHPADTPRPITKPAFIGVTSDLIEELRRKNAEIRHWKARCSSAEKSCKSLEAKNGDLTRQSRLRSGEDSLHAMQSFVDRLQTQLRELEGIRHSAEICHRLQFASLPEVDGKNIDDLMKDLAEEIQQLDTSQLRSPIARPGIEATAAELELAKLVANFHCQETASLLGMGRSKHILTHDPILIQVLVGVAISEWVFECSTRDLFEDNSQDAVYPAVHRPYDMLYDLVAHKDPLLARNADFEVHRAIIEEPTFSELCIKPKAQKLGQRMADMLSLSVGQEHQKLSHGQRLGTGGSILTELLTKIFAIAMQVRTQLLLSEDDFGIRTVAPNAHFGFRVMKKTGETLSPRLRGGKTATPATVRLMILPGIQIFKRGSCRMRIDYDQLLMVADVFADGGTCLVPALVACSDFKQ